MTIPRTNKELTEKKQPDQLRKAHQTIAALCETVKTQNPDLDLWLDFKPHDSAIVLVVLETKKKDQ
ncbi:MAG: hypothetical protein CMJ20_02445 [Phycisphaeraceae bacterium]|nr:hypothetical protein [Phycisphaeraceae bacterium]|tara:strand:- start:235 stop:432 length:198 start_codon:yes stop_codon:yes gene_type:complete